MATIKYLLSKVGDRPAVTLRLTISNAHKIQTRVRGVLAFRQWWSDAKQTHATKFVNPLVLPEVNHVNQTLAAIATHVLARFAATPIEDVTKAWLDSEIDKVLHPDKFQPKGEKAKTVMQAVDAFIAGAATRIQPRSGKPVTKRTIIHYNQMRKYLQAYLRRKRIKDMQVQQLDKAFYDDFVSFMYGEGLRPNTVGNHIKNLKAVINSLPLAQRVGVEFVERGKCVKITEDVDNVYLTEEELALLGACHYESARLERVRDEFLLLAWTGCRYSDLGKLSMENIATMQNGYQYFKLVQRKTETKVTIPILPAAKAVLEKYGYQLPKPISNQKFNEYLKEVCRLAGINDDVVITRNEVCSSGKAKRGAAKTTAPRLQLVTHHYKKWQCVTAHTARRSFATNMYKRNFPTLMIMAITGHKTERAFLTYIKVSEDENAERMMQRFMEQEYSEK